MRRTKFHALNPLDAAGAASVGESIAQPLLATGTKIDGLEALGLDNKPKYFSS
jgi:hypothetical protein